SLDLRAAVLVGAVAVEAAAAAIHNGRPADARSPGPSLGVGNPDRELVTTVAIEVTGRKAEAEVVGPLRRAREVAPSLGDHRTDPVGAADIGRRDDHRAGIGAIDARPGPDREVGQVVPVEIAERERRAELMAVL